jgi:hypothetical protein
MPDNKLQVIPLGGLGEFGMNCLALRYGDDILVLDAGMMFPDAELLGVDIVTPDFSSKKMLSMSGAWYSPTGMRTTLAGCPSCSRS